MKRYLRQLKPTVFDDLIAMNALYRPGPMQWIDDFIARKHGQKTIEYLDPVMKPALENTYGIMVYQEQVMQTAQLIAGYSLGQADILRKAMGKKMVDEAGKLYAQAAGIDPRDAMEKLDVDAAREELS